MKHVADPEESRKLPAGVRNEQTRAAINAAHPGLVAAGQQLAEDYDFDGIELALPTRGV